MAKNCWPRTALSKSDSSSRTRSATPCCRAFSRAMLRAAGERCLDQVLRLGTRNQHVRRHPHGEAVELLLAEDVLHGLVACAPRYPRIELGTLLVIDRRVGIRQQPCAVLPQRSQQQQLRITPAARNMRQPLCGLVQDVAYGSASHQRLCIRLSSGARAAQNERSGQSRSLGCETICATEPRSGTAATAAGLRTGCRRLRTSLRAAGQWSRWWSHRLPASPPEFR